MKLLVSTTSSFQSFTEIKIISSYRTCAAPPASLPVLISADNQSRSALSSEYLKKYTWLILGFISCLIFYFWLLYPGKRTLYTISFFIAVFGVVYCEDNSVQFHSWRVLEWDFHVFWCYVFSVYVQEMNMGLFLRNNFLKIKKISILCLMTKQRLGACII